MATLGVVAEKAEPRANWATCRVRFVNDGNESLDILSITPKTPTGVALQETSNSAQAVLVADWQALTASLSLLIWERQCKSDLFDGELRELQVQAQKQRRWWGVFSAIQFTFGSLLSVSVSGLTPAEARLAELRELYGIVVEDSVQATNAYEQYFDEEEHLSSEARLYRAKLDQLCRLEKKLNIQLVDTNDLLAPSLTTVGPGAVFEIGYVTSYKRSLIDPKPYSLSFEVRYREENRVQIASSSVDVVITPHAGVLSLVAVLSATLGLLLRVSVSNSSVFRDSLQASFVGGPIIAAAILALVVFNVFEYLKLEASDRLIPGWRSALLIGALCGLASEKFIDALKAFLG